MDGPQQGMPVDAAGPTGAQQQQHRTVSGPACAATTLILLALVGGVLGTVSDWRNYLVVHDFRAGAATVADLEAADTFSRSVSIPALVVYVAAGVLFLVWLWRARINAELSGGPAAQRRSRAWVVAGWFTPVANLWFPYQVVSDIWRAGAPRQVALRGLVTAWWVLYVADTMISRTLSGFYLKETITEEGLRSTANLATLGTVLDVAAGGLIVLIINRITTWQNQKQTLAQNAA
ncbi:DUF4328 domain-containing protein [Streptomyces sp. NPDC101227]|uniref:DUF4328 domain-containing protein n=1 Tax=Streptomyces sp. NPDC101227 TaxID=3366136 RepID=UPI0038103631